jgi:hypothetical protein
MSDDNVNRQQHYTPTGPDAQASVVADVQGLFGDQAPINETGGSFTAEEYIGIADIEGSSFFTSDDVFKDCPPSRKEGREAAEKKYGNKEASFAEVEAAVEVIPNNDVFLCEHSEGWASWHAWNNFGMAIYAATGGSDEGLKLYHRWSAKHHSYNIKDTDEKWKTFKRSPPREIGAGSIFYWADKADPQWRRRFIDTSGLEILPESQYFGERSPPVPPALVKGILPQTGVATIGGQSGTGKSFHAIHLGVRLIPDCNQHFYIDKYRIKRKGGVVYLVLEGKSALPMRVTAAFEEVLDKQLEFGERFKLPFCWNTYAPNLFEKGPENLLRLVNREQEKMRREFNVDLVAIFLDTMGLAACFENENMAAQVQRVVAGLNRVSDETGALCINVDHMGKDNDAGMRGTSAKRDCVETILACFCDRDKDNKPTNHRMQLFKVRDGEEGRVIPYRLEPKNMGLDEDGKRVMRCVVQWEPNRPMQGRKKQKNARTDVVLELAVKETGLPVEEVRLREAFYRKHGGDNKSANRAWHLALKSSGLRVCGDGLLDEV